MARLLGVGISLLAVLALIWGCWEKGVPAVSGSTVPPYLWETQESQPPTSPEEDTQPPYDPVAGAMLIASHLLPYDGPVLWDGEGTDLSSVAALELWNAGDTGVEYAQVIVWQGERELRFEVTYIPPGGRVIVPEKDASPYFRGAVTDIEYPVVVPMEEAVQTDAVAIAENGAFAMTVTNVTENTLSCVRVFYKQYDAQKGMYVGGVTYSAVLTDLKPGESRNLMPYCYAAGYAKVAAVVTEWKGAADAGAT